MSKPCPLCGQSIPDNGTFRYCMQEGGMYWVGAHRLLPLCELRKRLEA